MKRRLIVAIMITAATPALAENEQTATAVAVAPKPQKICRTADQATGSIMVPKRICHSSEEWAAIETAAAKARGPSAPVPSQLSLDALAPH